MPPPLQWRDRLRRELIASGLRLDDVTLRGHELRFELTGGLSIAPVHLPPMMRGGLEHVLKPRQEVLFRRRFTIQTLAGKSFACIAQPTFNFSEAAEGDDQWHVVDRGKAALAVELQWHHTGWSREHGGLIERIVRAASAKYDDHCDHMMMDDDRMQLSLRVSPLRPLQNVVLAMVNNLSHHAASGQTIATRFHMRTIDLVAIGRSRS